MCVVPHGEPTSVGHEHEGRTFSQGDVGLPRSQDVPGLAVNLDHGAKRVGVFASVMSTPDALWASVKFSRRARELIDAGFRSVSMETDDEGRLSGLALISDGAPALPGARVWTDLPPAPPPSSAVTEFFEPNSVLAAIAREANGGRVILNGPRVPAPSTSTMPAVVDLGRQRAEIRSQSLTAAHARIESDRRAHAERLASFAAVEAEAEELLLIASGTPTCFWPEHTDGFRRWKAFEEQLTAQRAAEAAEREEEHRLRLAERRRRLDEAIAERNRSGIGGIGSYPQVICTWRK